MEKITLYYNRVYRKIAHMETFHFDRHEILNPNFVIYCFLSETILDILLVTFDCQKDISGRFSQRVRAVENFMNE